MVVSLTCPFEYVRTAMQAQETSLTMTQVFRQSVQEYGVKRLWTGLGSTMLRDAPFSAIYWFIYEHVKEVMLGDQKFEQIDRANEYSTHRQGNHRINNQQQNNQTQMNTQLQSHNNHPQNSSNASHTPIFIHFTSGALAGMIAAAITNPLDVIKTRIQGNIHQKVTFGEAWRTVWDQKALLDGIGPRILRVAPACAIMISTYEMLKNFYSQCPETTEYT